MALSMITPYFSNPAQTLPKTDQNSRNVRKKKSDFKERKFEGQADKQQQQPFTSTAKKKRQKRKIKYLQKRAQKGV